MRSYVIMRYVGIVLLLNAFFMLASAGVSLFNDLDTGFYPLLLSFLLTGTVGAFPLIFVRGNTTINMKESYIIVVSSWVISSTFGMLPFLLWGGEFNVVNAFFESVSGYTTTGATILQNVEVLPKGMLFWRSCTHLIGGAGVVMFALAVLPSMGRAKLSLTNVEFSPLTKDNYTYKMQKAIRILLVVYIFLITMETLALKVAGMSWFDAVNHSFSTIATGGFSTKNTSIAYYDNIWIDIIITIFMVLAGLHFGLLFSSIQAKKNNIFSSEASVYYLMTIVVVSIIIAVNLWLSDYYTFAESTRFSVFQVASIISTTGFATVDTNFWPSLSILLLFILTFQCACAGSTTGGIKSDRIYILFKTFKARISQMQHPSAVIRIRLNNSTLSDDLISGVLVFALFYIFFVLIGTFILAAMGIDLLTSFSAMAACVGNVGPGFGGVSSMSNYSELPTAAKYVLSIFMLAGRLEILGFVQVFLIRSWR